MTRTILHIDASARRSDSTSRTLSRQVVDKLGADQVITRDLAEPLPLVTEDWIGANFTPPDQRSSEQKQALALSDRLVDEITRADTLVIGLPIYNFSIPASFKAWIDLVARVGLSFQYTETGPQGLLSGKRVVIALASGATAIGSDTDFASGYVRHVLGFIGLTDVTFIAADAMAIDPEASLAAAETAVQALAA
jgi:FMN-dependent NADH-azoreductase